MKQMMQVAGETHQRCIALAVQLLESCPPLHVPLESAVAHSRMMKHMMQVGGENR